MGNLDALFSLAYDRGGKVIEMIHNRLGDDRFFAFFRKIYHDYAFKTFHYADLKRELVAFDPSGDWAEVPRRLADRARRDRLGGRAGRGRAAVEADADVPAGDGRARAERADGRADGRALPLRRPATSACRSGPTGGATRSPAPRGAPARRGPLGGDGPGARRAVAGDRRSRPRPARRGARQQPLEARGRLAVHAADDAARRVVAVPGVRPAVDRRRAVHRPVRAGRLQGRRPAARPLAG